MAWCNEICVESAVKPQPTNQSKSVVFMSTRSSLCNPTHSLIYEQQIWGLPYVQCTKNCPTCENYIANYKIFQEHQLNSTRFPLFPGAISHSRRFPGVVEALHFLAFQHPGHRILTLTKLSGNTPLRPLSTPSHHPSPIFTTPRMTSPTLSVSSSSCCAE